MQPRKGGKLTPGEKCAYVFAVLLPLLGFAVAVALLYTVYTQPPAPPALAAPRCTQDAQCGGGACDAATGGCVCPPGFTGPTCTQPATPLMAQQDSEQSCLDAPRACSTTQDCAGCLGLSGGRTGAGIAFECADLSAGQSSTGVAGKFCTPQKPADVCKQVPAGVPSSQQIPGVYLWEGWKEVNATAWSCNCPSSYYPEDVDGACRKAPSLCAHGVWTYPKPGSAVGDAPSVAGECDCQNVPCTQDADCARGAVCDASSKTCLNQRLGLHPKTGLPTCVADTCAPHGRFLGIQGGAYGRCDCDPGYVNTGFSCVGEPKVALQKQQSLMQNKKN